MPGVIQADALDDMSPFSVATLDFEAINKLPIPPRLMAIESWACEASIGFIYGPRGLGKTMFAMHLAGCFAKGVNFGPWRINEPWPVLYIDGEMPLDATQERARGLGLETLPPEHFQMLHHEVLHHVKDDAHIDIADWQTQKEILRLALKRRAKVLMLDNLSCLACGVRENEGDDWASKLLPWFLQLRRERIMPIILAHAGRNGCMRGTSRREDPADWIIKLAPDESESMDGREGARFISRFEKARGAKEHPQSLSWHFASMDDGRIEVIFQTCGLREQILDLIRSGITSCTELSQELDVSRGQVSKVATRMSKETPPAIVIKSRDYLIP